MAEFHYEKLWPGEYDAYHSRTGVYICTVYRVSSGWTDEDGMVRGKSRDEVVWKVLWRRFGWE